MICVFFGLNWHPSYYYFFVFHMNAVVNYPKNRIFEHFLCDSEFIIYIYWGKKMFNWENDAYSMCNNDKIFKFFHHEQNWKQRKILIYCFALQFVLWFHFLNNTYLLSKWILYKLLYSEISILLSLDFIDNIDFIECPLQPIVNKRCRFYW